jgi:hypothetical protein
VILFIYKQSQPTGKKGKAGRGATKKHSAALDKLVAQQEASGTRAVWKDVYQVMECNSAACTNRGFSCWRHDNKHHKVDSDVMDRLIDCAEEGHKRDNHADMPEGIRELIRTREDEEEACRKRKRKASDPLLVESVAFFYIPNPLREPPCIKKKSRGLKSVVICTPCSLPGIFRTRLDASGRLSY